MPEKTGYIVIFVTVETRQEAERISNHLLTRKKVACVNMINGVNSSFWWKGKVDSALETLLIIKTVESVLDEVIKLIKEIHSYEVPEIIALPIIGGNDAYFEWIKNEVK